MVSVCRQIMVWMCKADHCLDVQVYHGLDMLANNCLHCLLFIQYVFNLYENSA